MTPLVSCSCLFVIPSAFSFVFSKLNICSIRVGSVDVFDSTFFFTLKLLGVSLSTVNIWLSLSSQYFPKHFIIHSTTSVYCHICVSSLKTSDPLALKAMPSHCLHCVWQMLHASHHLEPLQIFFSRAVEALACLQRALFISSCEVFSRLMIMTCLPSEHCSALFYMLWRHFHLQWKGSCEHPLLLSPVGLCVFI